MYLDVQGTIILEQADFQGNRGDSAAETGRYVTLSQDKNGNLAAFVTDKGILRHPESQWREDDVSSDQVAPLLAAASIMQPLLANRIIDQLKKAHYHTGNGNIISPGLYAVIRRHENRPWLWMSDLAILGQALIFKLPLRWNENKKTFDINKDVSDYLNFANYLKYASLKGPMTWPLKLAKKLINKRDVLLAVYEYYAPELNNKIILDLYVKEY